MAPHALIDLHDSSGYYPSTDSNPFVLSITERKCSQASVTHDADLPRDTSVKRVLKFNRQGPHVWHLSPDEAEDVEHSMRHFSDLNLPFSRISPRNFPLTRALRAKLRDVLNTLYGNQQFLVISGIESSRYDDRENVIIHAGLSSHVGGKRGMAGREGGDNTVLQHITSMPAGEKDKATTYHGPPNQNRDIPFHTDNGDIVSLFTISRSESGGSLYLADSTAVYEELASLRPELAHALCCNWTMVSPSPANAFDARPIAFPNHLPGRVLLNFSRARITGTPCAPRPPSLPPLSPTQRLALDALHALAAKHAMEIQLQPGDMVFFNNLTMMHARDAFVDNEAEGLKRHLLRLILRDEEMAYEVPGQLRETWRMLYDHKVSEEVFPVEEELFTWACSH